MHELKVTELPGGLDEAVAGLIHRSLVRWYERNLRQGARFGERVEPFLLFPRVYGELDPGEALAVFEGGEVGPSSLVGVCFVHERETHFGLGIVATDPDKTGRGAARAMLEVALARADLVGKPVRLVSSLLNLDSFSLYSRLGFVPHTIYQDIALSVPVAGLGGEAPDMGGWRMRLAGHEEAGRIADFEYALQGIRREKDYRFFLRGGVGDWQVWVLETAAGDLKGVLVSSGNADWGMLGPGVACDGDAAYALIWQVLDRQRGQTRVVLVPSAEQGLVKRLYALGGRNVELHVAQVRDAGRSAGGVFGAGPVVKGVGIPTFLPESA